MASLYVAYSSDEGIGAITLEDRDLPISTADVRLIGERVAEVTFFQKVIPIWWSLIETTP